MPLESLQASCLIGPAIEWSALVGGVSLGIGSGRWWACFFVIWLGAVLGALPPCEGLPCTSPVLAILSGWLPATVITLLARPMWGLIVPWLQAIMRVVRRGRRGCE